MSTARVSSKGQITLPAAARRKLGIEPHSRVEVLVQDAEIVIRPIKQISDLAGIFHEYTKGVTGDWETIRTQAEEAVAREVMSAIPARRRRH